MAVLNSLFRGFSNLAGLPVNIAKGLLTNYFLIIFAGGLIFFVANTPSEYFTRIFTDFSQGNIAGALEGIADASIAFASNVKENFNPTTLSNTLNSILCKVLGATGARHC